MILTNLLPGVPTMSDSANSSADTRKLTPRQVVISLFLLFYVYSNLIMAWPLPDSPEWENRLIGFAVPTLDRLGIWHRLRLFSPTPPQSYGYIFFEVDFTDGTTGIWQYPRTEFALGDQPNSFQRYIFYYLVWGADVRGEIDYPCFARFIAAQINEANKHPKTIRFVEMYERIPKPNVGMGKPLPKPERRLVLYTYDVASDKGVTGPEYVIW